MDHTLLLPVLALIVVALIFDYINGFHDAANSIATVVSTRVLTPGKRCIWAAFFNFAAAFFFGTGVAQTVGSGMVDLNVVTFAVIFGGLHRRDRLGSDHLVLRSARPARHMRFSAAMRAQRLQRRASRPSSSRAGQRR